MKILFQTMQESPNKSLVAHIARCASSLSPSTRRVCKCYGKGRNVMLWEKQSKCDCSSEDFTKPMLSLKGHSMNMQKESITLDSSQRMIQLLATQLERITGTARVSGLSLHFMVENLSFVDCKYFISKWSKELKCLKQKNKDKVPYSESFRNCSEGLNVYKLFKDKTLTEDQKDLLLWIYILQSFPKSSVCQDGCSRIELLNIYSQWKKGLLINVLPIMDFIMRKVLMKNVCFETEVQHVNTEVGTENSQQLYPYHVALDMKQKKQGVESFDIHRMPS